MFSLNKKTSFDQNYVFNTALESPQPDASNGVFLLINGVLEHFSDNKNQKSKPRLNKSFFVIVRGNLAEKRQKVGVRKSHFVFGSFELANSSFESPFPA